MKRLIAVLALIILVLAAAAPYLVGIRVDALFHQDAARLSAQTGYPIKVKSYQRGWFHAQAITQISLPNHTTLNVRHDITHGPYLVFGWARIKSIPQLANVTAVSRYFGDKPAVTTETRINFNGSVYVKAHSPAFRKTNGASGNATLIWGGAEASAHMDANHIKYSVTLPRLARKHPHGVMSLAGVTLTGSSRMQPSADRPGGMVWWDSKARLQVRNALLHNTLENLHVRTSIDWHIDSGLADSDNYAAKSRLRLSNAVFSLPLSGNSGPFKLDEAVLNVAIRGIPPQALFEFLTDAGVLHVRTGPSLGALWENALKTLREHLPAILAKSTTITFQIPTFDSDAGQLGLYGKATFDATRPDIVAGKANSISLAQRTHVALHASVDQSLLRRLGARSTLFARLLVRQHLLGFKNGAFQLDARFDPQKLTLNGRQLPRGLLQVLIRHL